MMRTFYVMRNGGHNWNDDLSVILLALILAGEVVIRWFGQCGLSQVNRFLAIQEVLRDSHEPVTGTELRLYIESAGFWMDRVDFYAFMAALDHNGYVVTKDHVRKDGRHERVFSWPER